MQNHNAAYDLSVYERAAVPARRESRSPELRVTRGSVQKKRSFAKAIFTFGILLGFIGMLIYSKVQLTEVGDEILIEEANLGSLESENTRLSMLIENQTSFKTIEEYATEKLGLVKPGAGQIIYVGLSDGSRIEVPENGFSGFWGNISTFFGRILEYIGL